ncbi:universal stress protein [Streptomyces gobiensis]|uniref:universal stress protein n=1 Tax=Streptomyces gobiensis TaxID=2875706 RepID=UPI001E49C6B9|nr:universal stress protein [Streptomyces gobiensis]UGY92279.1 universal stress protein [Streptomyces gobiensis]
MELVKPVVVGIDGTESALDAVEWAADRAQRQGAPLLLVHAVLRERYAGADRLPAERIRKEAMLATAAGRAALRAPMVKVMTRLLPDPPVWDLPRVAVEASLLVVGSRGRGTLVSLLLGSVGSGAAAFAGCPVVVMRGRVGVPQTPRPRVVVGVAEQEPHAAVVEFAFGEAARCGGELLAVRAWRGQPQQASDSLEDALAEGLHGRHGVRVVRRVVEGSAHSALLDASYGAELLVVGARPREGRRGIRLTPLHHAILHRSHCPVAVVPVPC